MKLFVAIRLHPKNGLKNCNFSHNHALTSHRKNTEVFCFILRSNITGLFSDFIVKCIDKNFAFSDVDEIQSVANFSFAHNNFSCAKFLRFEIWT